jgi:hypothetical protein
VSIQITTDPVTSTIDSLLPSFGPQSGFDEWFRRLPFTDARRITRGDFRRGFDMSDLFLGILIPGPRNSGRSGHCHEGEVPRHRFCFHKAGGGRLWSKARMMVAQANAQIIIAGSPPASDCCQLGIVSHHFSLG